MVLLTVKVKTVENEKLRDWSTGNSSTRKLELLLPPSLHFDAYSLTTDYTKHKTRDVAVKYFFITVETEHNSTLHYFNRFLMHQLSHLGRTLDCLKFVQ